jgi:hypothetical protein
MILLDFTFVSFLINIIPIKLVPATHLDMEKSRESVLTSVVKSDIWSACSCGIAQLLWVSGNSVSKIKTGTDRTATISKGNAWRNDVEV